MSSRQTTIAVYADKDRIYCGESQDCCRCINFQTSEMALFNIWRPHKGFVLFIYENRYIIWVKLWKSLTIFPRSVYSVECRTVFILFDSRSGEFDVKSSIVSMVSMERNNSIKLFLWYVISKKRRKTGIFCFYSPNYERGCSLTTDHAVALSMHWYT